MIYLLIFAAFYLITTSVILIRNRFEFEALASRENIEPEEFPFVSICIPARNEESNIERCVTSALKQDYPNFEVLVLDDNSTDGTTEILSQLSGIINNLKHISGAPKPDNWLGKPWACHQLSKHAEGEILLFIDADVSLEPHALKSTVNALSSRDAITVWPQQKLGSFWENMIVPLVYFALLTLLPAIYVERAPKWMPKFLLPFFEHRFVAACGQFFAFKRYAYDSIGGHASVKEQVVDDMALARVLKQSGNKLAMLHGINSVYCRMYTSHKEIWSGFRKNFLAGFESMTAFILMGILHLIVFILPLITLIYSIVYSNTDLMIISGYLVTLIIAQRVSLSFWFKWNPFYALLHFISVIWFQVLAVRCMLDKASGTKPLWKDREV